MPVGGLGAKGLRTRRQWEVQRAGYRARTRTGSFWLGVGHWLRCCAPDRGEGRLSWWRWRLGLGSMRAG